MLVKIVEDDSHFVWQMHTAIFQNLIWRQIERLL